MLYHNSRPSPPIHILGGLPAPQRTYSRRNAIFNPILKEVESGDDANGGCNGLPKPLQRWRDTQDWTCSFLPLFLHNNLPFHNLSSLFYPHTPSFLFCIPMYFYPSRLPFTSRSYSLHRSERLRVLLLSYLSLLSSPSSPLISRRTSTFLALHDSNPNLI